MNNLNKDFLEKLKLIYTSEELEKINFGFKVKRKTTFRLNKCKKDFDAIKELKKLWFKFKKIDFLQGAYLIEENWNVRLAETKAFKDGYIYVQWITSQIPTLLVWVDNPKNILDLTAAPWGKTTQIACKYPNSKVYANELNKIRFEKLAYTINKQGVKNIELLNMDARNLKGEFKEWFFNVIIADLPCSAEWRIDLQKEKTFKFLEKPGINKRNYRLQQDILKNTISLLKSGWEFIYSTCTLDPLENEWIVHYLLINFPEFEIVDISDFFDKPWLKEISKPWITSYKKYIFKKEVSKSIRLLPSEISEWFFVAKFRKK